MTAIGDIAVLLRNGKSIKQSEDAGGFPITRIETIANGEVDPSRVGYAGLEEKDADGWFLENGDILISHINSTKHLGKSARYVGVPERLVHGMNLLVVRVDSEKYDSAYIHRAMSSPAFKKQLPKITKDSVNQSSFNISNFKKLSIPTPPLAEQKRIAAILDAADALRAKRRESIEQLDKLAHSVFLDMFGDPVTNPKGWKTISLGDSCDFQSGNAWKAALFNNDGRGTPVVRIQNVGSGDYDLIHTQEQIIKTQFWINQGDLLLTLSGSFRLEAWHGERALLNQRIVKITPSEGIDRLYFESALRSNLMAIEKMGRHALVNNVAMSDLKNLSIAIPPADLQKKYASIISSLRSASGSADQHFGALNELFASLQSRAFSGSL